jgi:hypothetical protein
MIKNEKCLSPGQTDALIKILKSRFEINMARHTGLDWSKIESRLIEKTDKLWSLDQMENTGGEPDVIGYDQSTDDYIFCDCSDESPKGRRSFCYDHQALTSRKENKPKDSALNMATEMGIKLMTEEEYRALQKVGKFDLKTSSWVLTPDSIRNLGGAIFCDRRYDTVFVYHNGAESYYASRGFRGILRV